MDNRNNNSFSSFSDLGKAFGRQIPENRKGKNMNSVPNKPLPEYVAVTKYYNHNKRYGFVFVKIPANTTLDFDLETSERDDLPGTKYQRGEVAERELVIEAFIHGSVIERNGYDCGLEENQELKVKITKNDKGIQVVWTPNKDGSRPRTSNEPRVANAFLKFVPAVVKTYHEDRSFGFVKVTHDSQSGEPLLNSKGEPTEIDAHFTRVTLQRAGYSKVKEGMEIGVKYYTREDGRSSVAQFKFPDVNTDPECVAPRDNQTAA